MSDSDEEKREVPEIHQGDLLRVTLEVEHDVEPGDSYVFATIGASRLNLRREDYGPERVEIVSRAFRSGDRVLEPASDRRGEVVFAEGTDVVFRLSTGEGLALCASGDLRRVEREIELEGEIEF